MTQMATEIETTPAVREMEVATVFESTYAHAAVHRGVVTLPDGQTTHITVLRPNADAQISLEIDRDFLARPIALDNKLLISQGVTAQEWGRPAGLIPEAYLPTDVEEAVAYHPTNAGWQLAAWWVTNGTPQFLVNDQGSLTGNFEVLGMTEGSWRSVPVTVRKGAMSAADIEALRNIEVGFTAPAVLRDGEVVPLDSIIADPRIVADVRNLLDMSYGNKLPGDFWLHIRQFLPDTPHGIKKLFEGNGLVTRNARPMDPADLDTLEAIINQYKLDKFTMKRISKDRARLKFNGKFPLNRIPCFGLGYTADNQFITVAVDGRQPGISAGCTIEELGAIMKKVGAQNAYLGSAGGDVAFATTGGMHLNLPPTNGYKTRPVPSALIIK